MKKTKGNKIRPRLAVFRSLKSIYAQVIDDEQGRTLVAASSYELAKKSKQTKAEQAGLVGELLAQKALKEKIKKVVFDRRAYKYHGRVKALADGARKGGLDF